MAGPNLPTNIDITYGDSGTDASVKLHQQYHDSIHGVLNLLDTTVAPVLKGAQVLSIKDYGTVGDGVANDTAAVQAAIDAAPVGARVVGTPGATYSVTDINITSKTGVTFDGQGARLLLRATGAPVGVRLAGTCTGVEVCNWRITGNGVVGDSHAGVYCNSGQTLTAITVRNNVIRDTTLGISLSADGSGSIDGLLIQGNDIENIVGTASGTGYGIHHASSSATPASVRIVGNRVSRAQRHAIYQAKGAGAVIANNNLHRHREGVATGSVLPALMLARSADVLVVGNVVSDYYDGAMYVGGDSGGTFSLNYRIVGNLFARQMNAVNSCYIGTLGPATDGIPTDVVFAHNSIRPSFAGATAVYIQNGKRMEINDNYIVSDSATSSTGIRFAAVGETGATATYSDDITIARNKVYMLAGVGIRLNSAEAVISTLRFYHNILIAPALWAVGASITNPNITVDGTPTTGLTALAAKAVATAGPTTTTAPGAGGAGALPATPLGYLTVMINGVNRSIAYY